jgi:putative PIN family toxin of toxin-antitoxin system
MRVVLDTNIFVSALLTPSGVAATVLQMWREGRFDLVTSSTVLAELRRVLNYPKFERLRERHSSEILDLMVLLGTHSI